MIEQPTFEASIYDYISVNGRISKKLFEKVVIPKLKKLNQVEAENKRLREVLEEYIDRKATNGYVCECTTYCDCYEKRIITLESALIDMSKALEIATTYGLPPHDVSGREAWLSIYETKKLHQELLSEIGRDGK